MITDKVINEIFGHEEHEGYTKGTKENR